MIESIKNYYINNRLLLTMGLVAYVLCILSYTLYMSFQSLDGFWKTFIIIGPALFFIFFFSLIITNKILGHKVRRSYSIKKAMGWGALGGLLTSVLTTVIICILVLVYDSGSNKGDIFKFIYAVFVYTLFISAAPILLGSIFGTLFGYLKFKKVLD